MNNQIAAIDIDGVLADTHNSLVNYLALAGLAAPEDVPHSYTYTEMPEEVRQNVFRAFSDPAYYAQMMPVPGAIPAIIELSRDYRLVFITSRAWNGKEHSWDIKDITRRWLDGWLDGTNHEVVFCRHDSKASLLRDLYLAQDIAFAVEDKPETCEDYRAAGIRCYCIEYPYNNRVEENQLLVRVPSLWTVIYLQDSAAGRVRSQVGYPRGPFDGLEMA